MGPKANRCSAALRHNGTPGCAGTAFGDDERELPAFRAQRYPAVESNDADITLISCLIELCRGFK
jgi:hypothetical protein